MIRKTMKRKHNSPEGRPPAPRQSPERDAERATDLEHSHPGFDADEGLADKLRELEGSTSDEDPLAGGDLLDEEEAGAYLDEEDDLEDDREFEDAQEAEQQGKAFEPRDTSMFIEATRHGDAELVPGITGSTTGRLQHLETEEDTGEVPEPRADEDIFEDVTRALMEDPTTTQLDLQVEVREGVVTIRGEVQSPDDADNAVATALGVPGVEDVEDETAVQGL